jgi:hypothetical protein
MAPSIPDSITFTTIIHLAQATFQKVLLQNTVKTWNQLPASLLASFPSKLNTFRKRVKNVVTGKGIQVRIECK